MRCPNCNSEVPEGKRFCGYCGRRLTPAEASAAPPVPDAFDDEAPTQLVTGETPAQLASARAAVAQQIAFYASTPAYGPVLELHGWDFGPQLTSLSLRGRWDEMTELITDEVLETVAVVAPLDEPGAAIRARYNDRLDRISYYSIGDQLNLSDAGWMDLIAATRG